MNVPADSSTPHAAIPEPAPPAVDPPPPAVSPPQPPPQAPPPAAASTVAERQAKSPRVAAFFALFPGLGHVYNGLYQRAAIFFGGFALAIVLAAETGNPLFGLLIPFIFLFSLLDSYRQAKLINLGYATDLGLSEAPQRLRPGQGSLLLGIALLLIGALELLGRVGLWRWEWLVDYWPVPVMLLGAWLVFAALRERAKSQREEIDTAYGESF